MKKNDCVRLRDPSKLQLDPDHRVPVAGEVGKVTHVFPHGSMYVLFDGDAEGKDVFVYGKDVDDAFSEYIAAAYAHAVQKPHVFLRAAAEAISAPTDAVARPLVAEKKKVFVAAAFITMGAKVLLQQRPATKDYPLHWECPGGKLEVGETEREAVSREIEEELNLPVEVAQFPFFRDRFGEVNDIHYSLFEASISGPDYPTPMERQGWGWFSADEAEALLVTPGNARARDLISARLRKLQGADAKPAWPGSAALAAIEARVRSKCALRRDEKVKAQREQIGDLLGKVRFLERRRDADAANFAEVVAAQRKTSDSNFELFGSICRLKLANDAQEIEIRELQHFKSYALASAFVFIAEAIKEKRLDVCARSMDLNHGFYARGGKVFCGSKCCDVDAATLYERRMVTTVYDPNEDRLLK